MNDHKGNTNIPSIAAKEMKLMIFIYCFSITNSPCPNRQRQDNADKLLWSSVYKISCKEK